jgi:hypothetical protein
MNGREERERARRAQEGQGPRYRTQAPTRDVLNHAQQLAQQHQHQHGSQQHPHMQSVKIITITLFGPYMRSKPARVQLSQALACRFSLNGTRRITRVNHPDRFPRSSTSDAWHRRQHSDNVLAVSKLCCPPQQFLLPAPSPCSLVPRARFDTTDWY